MSKLMKTHQGKVWSGPSARLPETMAALCEAAGLYDALTDVERVILKPNLVQNLEPPITTPAPFVGAIIDCINAHYPDLAIIIAEGTGSFPHNTFHCFEKLGYLPLGTRKNVELVDLNSEPSRHLINNSCSRWPEMYLPELIFNGFLISVPVLKAHSLAKVTLTMKNMMGCAPPAHFKGDSGWGKSAFHARIHEAIYDLNRYRTPDFTIMDCSIGMAQAHLWGPTCHPPVGKIAVGHDPVAIDAYGTSLLKKSWRDIGHIALADTVLGTADPVTIIEPVTV